MIFTLGRSARNDFQFDDTTVSRRHATIEEFKPGVFRLTDLGSTAGTHIRAESGWTPIESVEITADAEIRVGETIFTIHDVLDLKPDQPIPHEEPRKDSILLSRRGRRRRTGDTVVPYRERLAIAWRGPNRWILIAILAGVVIAAGAAIAVLVIVLAR